ncbi:MAG: hypothetical protein R3B82_07820 [Sandaracinaceae bacterium]
MNEDRRTGDAYALWATPALERARSLRLTDRALARAAHAFVRRDRTIDAFGERSLRIGLADVDLVAEARPATRPLSEVETTPAPLSPPPAVRPPPPVAPPPREAPPPPMVAPATQAAALRAASRDGAPFCEMCERARREANEREAADAAALRTASAGGGTHAAPTTAVAEAP